MFVGDRRLTLLTLAVVAIAAAVSAFLPQFRAAAAPVILIGAGCVLADSVLQAVRKARR